MTKKYKDSSFDQGDLLFSREILFEVEIVYKADFVKPILCNLFSPGNPLKQKNALLWTIF